PALTTYCLDCHGGKSVRADFDLSTREKLLESGMIDKTAEDSYLMALITHAEEPFMPFKEDRLSKSVIDAVSKWIELGAQYDKPLVDRSEETPRAKVTQADREFWSFLPLRSPEPPAIENDAVADWSRTTIDRFIAGRLETAGASPNPIADRRTLIRRATFDLLGLPPTPREIQAFVEDPDPTAYEKLVDRLLASPRYGERYARHWMDVAR